MLLRYIIRRSEYQGNVWSFISDVTYWKDRISFAMFHGLCDGLGLNRFIEAVLYHYCLRDGRKYSDEGIYTERIPYDPAEETDIHSKAADGGAKMTNEKELYERANPVSKTAITTLAQRAAAGYEKAAEILKETLIYSAFPAVN